VVQNHTLDKGDRKLYNVLALLVSLIGLISSFLASYFSKNNGIMIQTTLGILVALLFACIVIFILRNNIFPTSNATKRT
jgi:uncharacterized membrane protein